MNRSLVALAVAVTISGVCAREPALVAQPSIQAPVTIPFELVTRHVVVQAKVNNSRPLSFLLDTGANLAILKMATATELGLSLEENITSGGAGPGRQTGRRVRKATWSLVGLEKFSQPLSLTIPMTALATGLGHDIDGIIGAEFIKQFVLELDYQARTITLHDRTLAGNIGAQIAGRFRMIFDYGRRRLILEPSPSFADPFDRATSGIVLRSEGADHRIFRVRGVLENSPGSDAGLAEGDVIASVDGIAAGDLTLTRVLEMLERPVARQLKIQRGEQVLEITLTPRRLI